MRSGRLSGARLRRAPVVSGPCSYPSCSTEDLAMRTYDFTPLWRSTIGFDRFFDLVDAAQHAGSEDNYPPCNVERLGEDRYQISLALAGFARRDRHHRRAERVDGRRPQGRESAARVPLPRHLV